MEVNIRPPQLDTASLLQLVQLGHVPAVRRYLDLALNGHEVTRPDWSHLQTALAQKNLPMMRLLVTWGARPDKDDLKTLTIDNIRQLRLAGVSLNDLPDMTSRFARLPMAVAPAPAFDIEKIPQAWRRLLQALQQNGAPEAVIAGGALRDLYNGRKVKDVDIFLCHRFLPRRLIKRAFETAGFSIKEQVVVAGYGTTMSTKFNKSAGTPFDTVKTKMHKDNYGQIFTVRETTSGAEAWTVISTPDNIEFNIVFVKDTFARILKAQQSGMARMQLVTGKFDLGICQIAFDGQDVYATQAYHADVAAKTLTLVNTNDHAPAHVRRVQAKYQDFTLCPAAARLSGMPPEPSGERRAR